MEANNHFMTDRTKPKKKKVKERIKKKSVLLS